MTTPIRDLTRLFGVALTLLLLGSARADVPERRPEAQHRPDEVQALQPAAALGASAIQLRSYGGPVIHSAGGTTRLTARVASVASQPTLPSCIHALEPARADAARPPPSLA